MHTGAKKRFAPVNIDKQLKNRIFIRGKGLTNVLGASIICA